MGWRRAIREKGRGTGKVSGRGNSTRLPFPLLLTTLLLTASPSAAQDPLPFLRFAPPGAPVEEAEPPPCEGELCQRLNRQLEQGCGRTADLPYADTIWLRQNTTPDLPPEAVRAITLALAGNDPALAAELLTPHLAAEEAETRYAAGLYLALIHAEAGASLATPAAQSALGAMDGAAEATGLPPSDLHFLRALAALERGDTRRAADLAASAVAAEPRFFNALALAIRLAIDAAAIDGRRGASLCTAAYLRLMDYASLVMDLDPCAYQGAHLDIYLSRRIATPADSAPYQAVKVYLALIARRPDIATAARDRVATAEGPVCKADVLALLDELIRTAEAGR